MSGEYANWVLHRQPADQVADHKFSIWSGEHPVILANEVPGEEGALAHIIDVLNGTQGRHCEPGHVLMPQSRDEAQAMYLVAEKYLFPEGVPAPAQGLPSCDAITSALRHYANTYCEGWCKDAPANSNFDDCGGCRARLALNTGAPAQPTEMREALAPFAALVPAAFDHSYPDDAEIVLSYNGEPHAVLKNIDFRRALSALSSTGSGGAA